MNAIFDFCTNRSDQRDARRTLLCAVMVLSLVPGISAADDLALIAEGAQTVLVMGENQPLRAQFEPMLKVELSFVNRVCQLTDDERRTLISKCSAWLDAFVIDNARRGNQPQNLMIWMGGRAAGSGPNDPRTSIQAGVKEMVAAALSKEKVAVYEDECRKRDEFAQKVAVESLVAQMDRTLKLAPEQREKIETSLGENWQKSWAPHLETFIYEMNMWPNVPDQWVRPHLRPAQQAAWNKLNKANNNRFFGGGMFGMEAQVIDDIDLNEGKEKAANEKAPDEKKKKAVPIRTIRPL